MSQTFFYGVVVTMLNNNPCKDSHPGYYLAKLFFITKQEILFQVYVQLYMFDPILKMIGNDNI